MRAFNGRIGGARIGGLVGVCMATFNAASQAGWSPGAVFASAGVLLVAAFALLSLRDSRRARFYVPFGVSAAGAVCFAVWSAVGGVSNGDPEARARQIEDQVLARNPPLAVVVRREPAIWADVHGKLVAFLRDRPNTMSDDAVNMGLAALFEPLSERIANMAVRASDATVVAIYSARLALVQTLQAAAPEGCKSYVAADYKGLTSLPGNLREQLRVADQPLYAAYEEGVGKPMPALLSEAQADAASVRLQDALGVRLTDQETERLAGVGSAAEVCDATVKFMKVLTLSPAPESAPVIRSLLIR